jgi:hypothetical protein
MQTTHALYLTDASIVFYDLDKQGARPVFTQPLSESNYIESFQAFLLEHQPESISVYLDVLGEEFKQEPIPHVGGKDRELLLSRKCKSLFPSADLNWKKHLYREKKGRKDDIYILVGIPLPSSAEHVFEALIQTKQKISGVQSISLLECDIHDAFPSSKQSLIVSKVLASPEGKSVYRQTFFKDGELAMSRVTSINGETSEQILPRLLNEIERMHHFLAGTRQVDNESKLDVFITLDEGGSNYFTDLKSNAERINIETVELSTIADSQKLKSVQPFSSLAELLMDLSTRKNIKPHFKPKGLCESYNVIKVKGLLKWVSIALLSITVIVAGFLAYTASVEKSKIDTLSTELLQLTSHRKALVNDAKVTDVEPMKMKQVVDLYQLINDHQYGPNKVLDVIARAYIGFRLITLREVNWLKDKQEKSNNKRRKNNSAPFVNTLKAPREFELKISMPSGLGNRAILKRVSAFSLSLTEQPEIKTVTREQAALDASASAQIEESLGDTKSANRDIEFTLLVTMELL